MDKYPTVISTEKTRKLYNNTINCIPATKQFVVNATGNLFLATTLSSPETPEEISDEAKKAFGQVSVFFAALTKAMTDKGQSLFDYETLNQVVESSGMFVNVTQSEVEFSTKSYGADFSSDLVQALFGLGGNLAKALSDTILNLVSSMGSKALKISYEDKEKDNRVGTIIFVCEYLLGAVSITPIIFSIDAKESKVALEASPCFKVQKEEVTLKILKEVHLFVPPEFIVHAIDLNSAMASTDFENLVASLKNSIIDAKEKE